MNIDLRIFLTELFNTVVAAGHPYQMLADHLPEDRSGRTTVIGAGKAAGAMAEVVGKHWQDEIQGLVVTPYRYGAQCNRIEVVGASCPMPGDAGERVARRVLELISGLNESGRVIFLPSGSGSVLLSLPVEGISLASKQAMNKALFRSGATIGEMNCVRKHLSVIKGGRLTKVCQPASIYTYTISDVPGDEAMTIASDPNVGNPTTSTGTLVILGRYAADVPQNVLGWPTDSRSETVRPNNLRLVRSHSQLIATPQNALDAATVKCRTAGFSTLVLGDPKGEAREVTKVHTGITQQIRKHGQPLAAPCMILFGGETIVTVRDSGRDGRSAEFLLSLTAELKGEPNIQALAGDTDSIDGSEDNTGTPTTPRSHVRGEKVGLEVCDELGDNNGYSYFQTLGNLLVTKPTRTNVNDFRAILIFES